jgi:hypothetical protein
LASDWEKVQQKQEFICFGEKRSRSAAAQAVSLFNGHTLYLQLFLNAVNFAPLPPILRLYLRGETPVPIEEVGVENETGLDDQDRKQISHP